MNGSNPKLYNPLTDAPRGYTLKEAVREEPKQPTQSWPFFDIDLTVIDSTQPKADSL